MGLKWEYTQPTTQPLEAEHWDAQAFINFASDPHPQPLRRLGVGSPNGERHHILSWLPPIFGSKDPMADATKEIIIQAIEAAIIAAVATGSTTLVITLPSWVPIAVLVLVLGEIARRQIWKRPESKLMNIRLVCPTPEIYDAVNHYFQGTWELP